MFGFSFKRLTGVTRIKTAASRILKIPLTKTGRSAKVGRKILNK